VLFVLQTAKTSSSLTISLKAVEFAEIAFTMAVLSRTIDNLFSSHAIVVIALGCETIAALTIVSSYKFSSNVSLLTIIIIF